MKQHMILAVCILLSVNLVVSPSVAQAPRTQGVWRIGSFSPAGGDPALEGAFLGALRDLGYVEGKNLVFERRYAHNRLDQLPVLAAELVDLKVDLVIATGTVAPLAMKRVSTTIPVVIWSAGDPVGTGIVSSLARPGGNITGLTIDSPELAGKRLQLLKEIDPSIARVGVIWNATNPYSAVVLRETQEAARVLQMQVQSLELRGPNELDRAFAATAMDTNGLIVVEDPLTFTLLERIVNSATLRKLPVMYGMKEFVAAGGLIAYGPSYPDLLRRAATYVDKILKGAKPSDLPIEQPTKFDLAINLNAAKSLGLTIPQSLLLRADEVIQ